MSSQPVRPLRWHEVIRALREAGGFTQEGWVAQLGVSRGTLQKWEGGAQIPDRVGEDALVAYCYDRGLFAGDSGRLLHGVVVNEQMLRDLLADARLAALGVPARAYRAFHELWVSAQPTSHFRPELEGGRMRGLVETTPRFTLASPIRIVVELDQPQYMLLLDESTDGKLCCLCPSRVAPQDFLPPGRHYLPSRAEGRPPFEVNGPAGKERLLALLSAEPFGLNWLPEDTAPLPVRIVDEADLGVLVRTLQARPPATWTAWAAAFEVVE